MSQPNVRADWFTQWLYQRFSGPQQAQEAQPFDGYEPRHPTKKRPSRATRVRRRKQAHESRRRNRVR
jgi:hypothetical protein